jgi:threonine dehydrogenase-like Zn-dependent dehydrogenase
MSIGFTAGLGSGWADQVLAHRSMLHPIPDAVPDEIASLHEPVSVAVHALLRKPPA